MTMKKTVVLLAQVRSLHATLSSRPTQKCFWRDQRLNGGGGADEYMEL